MNQSTNSQFRFTYIDLTYSPGHSSVDIHFAKLASVEDPDFNKSKDIATAVAKIFLEIVAKMTGSRPNQFILSRPKERIYKNKEKIDIQYGFTFLMNSELLSEILSKWKSITLLLHLREWNSFRNIDDNCVDLYVTVSDKWDYNNYVPDCFSSEAIEFVNALKPFLEEKICEAINIEPGINASNVIFADPLYVEEGMPVTGADAFEFKGTIAE